MIPLLHPKRLAFFYEPPDFDTGKNKAEGECILSADDDWSVCLEFLKEFQDRRETYRSYKKEMERFMLWLIHERGCGVSSVLRGDWLDYLAFLARPTPVKKWVGKKGIKKWLPNGNPNPDWRPFATQEPSAASINLSSEVIKTFFAWLVEGGYLNANPCSSRTKRVSQKSKNLKMVAERIIPEYLMNLVFKAIEEQIEMAPASAAFTWNRILYVMKLYYHTGIRLSEGLGYYNGKKHITATMGWITPNTNRTKWFLNVVGKGMKPRRIELLPEAIEAIKQFRAFLGLPEMSSFHEPTPLIPRIDLKGSLNASSLDRAIKSGFAVATAAINRNIPPYDEKPELIRHDQSVLRNASAHWLRHSHATWFLKFTGGNLKATMDRLGHGDVNTTMLYQHLTED